MLFDTLKETYDTYKNMPVGERGSFATIMVFKYLACMTYYIVAGVVIWALGRRLIQASFAAYRESRRERT
jgi:hypothetical protein